MNILDDMDKLSGNLNSEVTTALKLYEHWFSGHFFTEPLKEEK